VRDVSDLTGFPEIMDGRVKTLHPAVHGGLLGVRDDPEHAASMAAHGIAPIDLVVVNLYPFEDGRLRRRPPDVIENIDIGGPAMIRAAAKNHAYVAVVTDPADYAAVLDAVAERGAIDLRRRQRSPPRPSPAPPPMTRRSPLVRRANSTIEMPTSAAFGGKLRRGDALRREPAPIGRLLPTGEAARRRHRPPAPGQDPVLQQHQRHRRRLRAGRRVRSRRTAAVAIIKHANPCGVATAATLTKRPIAGRSLRSRLRLRRHRRAQPPLDAETAEEIVEDLHRGHRRPRRPRPRRRQIVAAKKNLRLLVTGGLPDPAERACRALRRRRPAGAVRDNAVVDDARPETRDQARAPPSRAADLRFAFRVAKHVKSNAIVYAKDGATVGIGAGQMSRVDAAHRRPQGARRRRAAGLGRTADQGSVVASDAFFPFADGL
jgi:phosphoribosylaminoimidazolecarboxamide formyltransferase/IMP cyclohydrolase